MKIGADIGGTWLRLGAWDGSELTYVEKCPCAGTAAFLADKLHEYIERIGGASSVTLGIPGTLSADKRTVLNTPNLALSGVPLADTLEEELAIPVTMGNDAEMLLRGDIAQLGRGSAGLALGLYIGTGLGGALFYNGQPLGLCEPGHMPIPGRKDRCGCGGTGCAEIYVSGKRLEALAHEAGTDISRVFLLPGVESFLDDFASVAAAAAVLIGPDILILGGGVVSAENFPRDRISDLIRSKCMRPVPADTLDIAFSSGEPWLGVLGAVLT